MKILCITGSFLPSIGGMQFSTHQTLIGLHCLGLEITLVSPKYENDEQADKDIPYKIIRYKSPGYINGLKRFILLLNEYRKNKYDKVFILGYEPELSMSVFKLFTPFNPIVLAAGTRIQFPNKRKWITFVRDKLLCITYTKACKIIVINDATKDSIISNCKIDEKKIIKIHRPIDDSIWKFKEKIKHDIFTVVSFSRFEKEKNIQGILEILYNVKKSNKKLKYLIIGDGEYEESLHKLVDELNLKDEVDFLGSMSQNEIVDVLHYCDLHILLSKRGEAETFGRVYAEAGFIKVPSIGFETSGTIEAIKDNYSGYMFDVGQETLIVISGLSLSLVCARIVPFTSMPPRRSVIINTEIFPVRPG